MGSEPAKWHCLYREKIQHSVAVTNVALAVEPADRQFISKRFMTACLSRVGGSVQVHNTAAELRCSFHRQPRNRQQLHEVLVALNYDSTLRMETAEYSKRSYVYQGTWRRIPKRQSLECLPFPENLKKSHKCCRFLGRIYVINNTDGN